jgi:PhnB protein
MPKHFLAEQLDQAITAMLASPEDSSKSQRASASGNISELVSLVRQLRALPRPEFKAALKSDLQRSISMNEATAASKSVQFRRANFPNIAPYFLVHGAPAFIDFLVTAFEGTERIRVPGPDGSIMHAEVGVGNSVIEIGDANEQYPQRSMTTHLYVSDAHDTYARALQAGATPIFAPTDEHPSGDLWGAAKDKFGNTWYIATPKGWAPGPEHALTVQPYLHVRDAHKMIPFIEAAFGAHTTGLHRSPDGIVQHATIEIAGATFEVDEAQGDVQPTVSYLHAYVPDTDAVFAQAVAAGAKAIEAPFTAPYGDRTATIADPFGNTWFLATYLGMK